MLRFRFFGNEKVHFKFSGNFFQGFAVFQGFCEKIPGVWVFLINPSEGLLAIFGNFCHYSFFIKANNVLTTYFLFFRKRIHTILFS